jgi:hypothetical protein
VDGVAQLHALPRHPALGEIWDKRIIPVLTDHQDKVDKARKELQDLSDDSSQLRASDLKQAKHAITRVQEELTQQLNVFLEYVGRILKVMISHACVPVNNSSCVYHGCAEPCSAVLCCAVPHVNDFSTLSHHYMCACTACLI